MDKVKIVDYTHEQPNPPRMYNGKLHHRVGRDGLVIVRDPATIDAITIHQTACVFGPANDAEKKHRRAINVSAHCTAFQDGTVAIAHPLLWYVYHAGKLNARSIGLECEGVFPGVGVGSDRISDMALASYCTALKELVDRARALGCPIGYIFAHRQSSGSRRSDPGAEIWKKVVLEFAVNALGLKTDVDFVTGDGRAIPKEWDPGGHVKF